MDSERCCLLVFSRCNNKSRNVGNRKSKRRRHSETYTYSTNLCGGGACKLPDRGYPPRTSLAALSSQVDKRALMSSFSNKSLSQFEEIELKCYRLSPDCLLVNSDKRCQLVDMSHGLTRTRLLCDFEDGRKHLDVRRPDSVSLIKFRIDPASGQIERRLSIHDIDQDNEFDSVVSPPGSADSCAQQVGSAVDAASLREQEQNKLKLSERLSKRSFVLIERAKPTSDDCAIKTNADTGATDQSSVVMHAISPPSRNDSRDASSELETSVKHVAQQSGPTSQLISESWEKIEEWRVEEDPAGANNDLEKELLSSISIKAPQQQQQQQRHERGFSSGMAPGKTKRKLSLARRLYKLISGGGSSSHSLPKASSSGRSICTAPVSNENATTSANCSQYFDSRASEYCDQSYQRDRQVVLSTGEPRPQLQVQPIMEQPNQLISLTRPESIHLWPNKQQIVSMMPSPPSSPPLVTSSTNPLGRQQQQQQQQPLPVAMISYNHAEAKDYAIALHAQLELIGISTYLDLYHIGKGEDWQDSLNGAILNCSLFIPLVTPSYGETLWTSRECKLADVLAKRIIPVNFGQKWPPPSLAIQLATLQYIDWLQSDISQTPPVHPDTVGCLGEQQSQSAISTTSSATRTLCVAPTAQQSHGPAPWPSQNVQIVARQLKLSIQSELNGAAGSQQTTAASGTARAIEQPPSPPPSPPPPPPLQPPLQPPPQPPSPHSDSNFYEEIPQQARPAAPVLGAKRHSKLVIVAPTRKTGTTGRPEVVDSGRTDGGYTTRRSSNKAQKGAAVTPLIDCSDTEPIMTCYMGRLSGRASPLVLSYGATKSSLACGSGELSPACSQSSDCMSELEPNGFKLKSTKSSDEKARRRHHLNTGFQQSSEHDCEGDHGDNTYEIIGCQEDNLIGSNGRMAKKRRRGHVSAKQMARKKSIGHHAKKVLSWVKRSSLV